MSVHDQRGDLAACLRDLELPAGVTIRGWLEEDFSAIQRLSQQEGWSTPLERPEAALLAWQRSWPALVAATGITVIGFSRALSDGTVTTYIAELLVSATWRRQGVASALLDATQRLCPGSRLDLLATDASQAFYQRSGFRAFAGFRRSWLERPTTR